MYTFKVEWYSGLSSGGCVHVATAEAAKATAEKVKDHFDLDSDDVWIIKIKVLESAPEDISQYEDSFYRNG